MAARILEGDGFRQQVQETHTCCHCQQIVPMYSLEGKKLEVAKCWSCQWWVCDECHAFGRCMNFERRLDQYDAGLVNGFQTGNVEREQEFKAFVELSKRAHQRRSVLRACGLE
jgi:hypothetical protein